MKQLKLETGGRPFVNDDLATLQQELTDAVQAQFLGKGPFILSGCFVSGPANAATVSAGIVCLGGQLLRFAGQSNVALPAQLQAGPAVLSDQRPYQTGGTKNCMIEVPAVLVASDPTYTDGEFLPLDTWGGLRWDDLVRASVRSVDEVQQVASLATADYDATGLGKPGTEAWGWGLSNGQGGRADLRGMFITGLDPARADYDTVGKTGGLESVTLTVSELPAHNHGASSSNTNTNDNGNGRSYQQVNETNLSDRNRRTGTTGGGQAHENRPPFYVLAMRQWVGL